MKNMMWVVVILVLGGIAAGYYYWEMHQEGVPVPQLNEAPPAPPVKAEPAIRHPITPPAGEAPLPPLAESDAALQKVLTDFFDQKPVQEFFNLKEIVRCFVVTVDNLPRKKVPMQYRLFKPVAGPFRTSGKEAELVVGQDNHRRYLAYVLLAETVDSKKLVATYVHYYPLFQEEYQILGYPKGYFNDRLVEAIDDMLATPDIKDPIKLVRPNVLYQYADPDLEALSAGQKILLRMGPENAARVKARLRQVRQELTGQMPSP